MSRGGARSSVSFLRACSVSVQTICGVNGVIFILRLTRFPTLTFQIALQESDGSPESSWQCCVYLNLSKLEPSQTSESVLPHFILLDVSWFHVSAVLYSELHCVWV